ncbi:MAG: AAA family ATPase [Fibrobacterota bacterium]|nr:AAA family ATPase [Fibrobacterota bacterium]
MKPPRFRHALVIGKFYPPHNGHLHLIETAATFSDWVTVVVLGASVESLGIEERVAWMRQDLGERIHVRVEGILDDFPVDYADASVWEGHIGLMRQAVILADKRKPFPPLDAVFSSEKYGVEMGARLGVQAIVLDPERSTVPVSGTRVRENLVDNWEQLPAGTRSGLCLRVVVLGAESTGTTTLCGDLSAAVRARGGIWERTMWVPEYGRDYSGALVSLVEQACPGVMPENIEWSEEDFLVIAREQTLRENKAAAIGSPYLVLDTDALATLVWHERYRHASSARLAEFVATLPRRDIYVITSPDGVAFEQDGLRDGEHLRLSMHERFREVVSESGNPWMEATGSRPERVRRVLDRLDALSRSRWNFTPPLLEKNKP